MDTQKYLEYLEEWIKEQVKAANAKGVIVGLSGGVDSAVVANIAKKAFPNNYLTVWMPCYSSDEDQDCVNEIVLQNQLDMVTVNLEETYDELIEELEYTGIEQTKLANANVKARLRMTSLYNLAQSKNYLVLGTDNADEWYIGYFTKFGDGGCDLLPIVHMLKREVREAAKILGVPDSIIKRAPTASLWENQTDEKEIGYSYDQIDDYLSGKEVDPKVKERVEQLHAISNHKRSHASMPNKK